MAITYHAGRRIQATQADFDGTPAISGGWKEVGRTTSSGSTITVSSLPDKRYYMILYDATAQASGGSDNNWRFNGDAGNNYAHRKQVNGTSDSTGTNQSKIYNMESGGSRHEFGVNYLANKSDKEKFMIGNNVINWTSGVSGDASRKELVSKWTNTSDVIDEIQLYYSAGSSTSADVVVLGYDPADTHTTNFWEPLADVTTGSTGALSSGTFTAKKYLWVQAYTPSSSNSSPDGYVEFNADSGSNYVHRRSHNGGSDTTGTSDGIGIRIDGSGGQTAKFHNMFIVNNSANEKLVICRSVTQQTAGAGNIPTRTESVGKWVNTSDQITRVDIVDQYASHQWGAGSFIKVWGSN